MRLNPTSSPHADDWLVRVTPERRAPFVVCIAWPATEDEAWRTVEHMLRWRKVGPARMEMRRRHETWHMRVLRQFTEGKRLEVSRSW